MQLQDNAVTLSHPHLPHTRPWLLWLAGASPGIQQVLEIPGPFSPTLPKFFTFFSMHFLPLDDQQAPGTNDIFRLAKSMLLYSKTSEVGFPADLLTGVCCPLPGFLSSHGTEPCILDPTHAPSHPECPSLQAVHPRVTRW